MTTKTKLPRGALALACLLASAPAWAQQPSPGAPDAPPSPSPSAPAPLAGITLPRLLNTSEPVYPPEAKAAGIEGEVVLTLDIDKQGHVTKVAVSQPAGHGFDEAAQEAAQKLEFSPALRPDGTPFAVKFKYRYAFVLPPPASPAQGSTGKPSAQQASQTSLSGWVLVAGGNVPIAGATVDVVRIPEGGAQPESPGALTVTTGEQGAFEFQGLAPGKYTVLVRAPGYKALEVQEDLAAREATEVKYRLVPHSNGAIEVTVEGERPPREVTKRTIEQAEIERIPGTNGDALKSLQSLPGVARPPFLLGLLIVRGSAPQDTQTFVDGTPVPIIYHFGGLSSVVPTESISKIDFFPGNFGTQYGRVQGGIVDVGLRDPKPDYHGLAQIDLIDARLLFEGPIPGLDGWTFLAAGRRSYVDAWLGPVLASTTSGASVAPVYYDYQFLVSKKPTPSSTFRVAFFGSSDEFKTLLGASPNQPELSGNFGFSTAFQRLQVHYTNDFGGGTRFNVVAAAGRDEIGIGIGAVFFNLDTRSLSGRAELSTKLGRGMTLDAGVDLYGGYTVVSAQIPPPPTPGQPPNGPFSPSTAVATAENVPFFQPGAYLEMEIAPDGNSRIVPGVRLDYYNITGQYDFSPRVNGRYVVKPGFPTTTLKAGVGLYQQPPQPQEVAPPFGTPNIKSNRSIQYSIGAEQEITRQIDVSVEGFYKQLDSQVTSAASMSGASAVNYDNAGTGYVIGGELLAKYKLDAHFFGWIAYTLSRSIRSDGPGMPQYLFQYDQPHILTVLGSYNFRNGWEFGAQFRLVSGNPVTPDVCSYGSPGCNTSRTNALFNAASGTYVAIPYTGPFSERLPLFHELDLRVDRKWQYKRWALSAYLDVQNAYNQGNVEGLSYNYNYTRRTYVSGLPFLPSIGARAEF